MKKLKKNSFLQGTFIFSLSLILIKIMGALANIPFYSIIGRETGGTLYGYAYNVYLFFYNIADAGIPLAMSMLVSEFIAKEMYDAKERTMKIGFRLVSILAISSFLIVFFGSHFFASFLLSNETGGHNLNDVSLVIKAISFCLLIIPFLGVLRGYLQGHKFMSTTSTSQIIEQIVRIAILLLGPLIAINIFKQSVTIGVVISLFGAFGGGLVAYFYLRTILKKNKSSIPLSKTKDDIQNRDILKKMLKYCIPVIILSVIDNLYTLIDIRLISSGLKRVGIAVIDSQNISQIISTWAPKICTIIISIAVALIANIIPHVTASYVKKDYDGVNYRINQALSTMLVVMVPLSIILAMLSKEAYTIFYGSSLYGPLILKASAVSHLFFGIWNVLNTSLQSMKKFKMIYINSLVGLVINACLDIPFILLLNNFGIPPYIGTIFATTTGYIISIFIVLIYLSKTMKFNYRKVIDTLKKIILPSLTIAILLFITTHFINCSSRLLSLLCVLIEGGLSFILYLIITYKNGTLESVLGKEFVNKIIRKLHLMK